MATFKTNFSSNSALVNVIDEAKAAETNAVNSMASDLGTLLNFISDESWTPLISNDTYSKETHATGWTLEVFGNDFSGNAPVITKILLDPQILRHLAVAFRPAQDGLGDFVAAARQNGIN